MSEKKTVQPLGNGCMIKSANGFSSQSTSTDAKKIIILQNGKHVSVSKILAAVASSSHLFTDCSKKNGIKDEIASTSPKPSLADHSFKEDIFRKVQNGMKPSLNQRDIIPCSLSRTSDELIPKKRKVTLTPVLPKAASSPLCPRTILTPSVKLVLKEIPKKKVPTSTIQKSSRFISSSAKKSELAQVDTSAERDKVLSGQLSSPPMPSYSKTSEIANANKRAENKVSQIPPAVAKTSSADSSIDQTPKEKKAFWANLELSSHELTMLNSQWEKLNSQWEKKKADNNDEKNLTSKVPAACSSKKSFSDLAPKPLQERITFPSIQVPPVTGSSTSTVSAKTKQKKTNAESILNLETTSIVVPKNVALYAMDWAYRRMDSGVGIRETREEVMDDGLSTLEVEGPFDSVRIAIDFIRRLEKEVETSPSIIDVTGPILRKDMHSNGLKLGDKNPVAPISIDTSSKIYRNEDNSNDPKKVEIEAPDNILLSQILKSDSPLKSILKRRAGEETEEKQTLPTNISAATPLSITTQLHNKDANISISPCKNIIIPKITPTTPKMGTIAYLEKQQPISSENPKTVSQRPSSHVFKVVSRKSFDTKIGSSGEEDPFKLEKMMLNRLGNQHRKHVRETNSFMRKFFGDAKKEENKTSKSPITSEPAVPNSVKKNGQEVEYLFSLPPLTKADKLEFGSGYRISYPSKEGEGKKKEQSTPPKKDLTDSSLALKTTSHHRHSEVPLPSRKRDSTSVRSESRRRWEEIHREKHKKRTDSTDSDDEDRRRVEDNKNKIGDAVWMRKAEAIDPNFKSPDPSSVWDMFGRPPPDRTLTSSVDRPPLPPVVSHLLPRSLPPPAPLPKPVNLTPAPIRPLLLPVSTKPIVPPVARVLLTPVPPKPIVPPIITPAPPMPHPLPVPPKPVVTPILPPPPRLLPATLPLPSPQVDPRFAVTPSVPVSSAASNPLLISLRKSASSSRESSPDLAAKISKRKKSLFDLDGSESPDEDGPHRAKKNVVLLNADGFDERNETATHTRCNICDRWFLKEQKQKIRYHVLHHCPMKAYQCRFCAYAHHELGKIKRHQRNVHKRDNADDLVRTFENELMDAAHDVYMKKCFPNYITGKLSVGRTINYPNRVDGLWKCYACKRRVYRSLSAYHVVDKHVNLRVFVCGVNNCPYKTIARRAMVVHRQISHWMDTEKMNVTRIDFTDPSKFIMKSFYPESADLGDPNCEPELKRFEDVKLVKKSRVEEFRELLAFQDGLTHTLTTFIPDVTACEICKDKGTRVLLLNQYDMVLHLKMHVKEMQWACPEIDCSFTSHYKIDSDIHVLENHEKNPFEVVNRWHELIPILSDTFRACFPEYFPEFFPESVIEVDSRNLVFPEQSKESNLKKINFTFDQPDDNEEFEDEC